MAISRRGSARDLEIRYTKNRLYHVSRPGGALTELTVADRDVNRIAQRLILHGSANTAT